MNKGVRMANGEYTLMLNSGDYLVDKKRDLFCFQILSKEEIKPNIRGKVHFYDSEDVNKQYRKNINKDSLRKLYSIQLELVTFYQMLSWRLDVI